LLFILARCKSLSGKSPQQRDGMVVVLEGRGGEVNEEGPLLARLLMCCAGGPASFQFLNCCGLRGGPSFFGDWRFAFPPAWLDHR
jgi:hypothetical protein